MNLLDFDSKLVFLNSQSVDAEPYTTSDIIAAFTGINHHSINSMINKGHVTFKMQRTKASRLKKVYLLNEKQASFLITLLKNTESVVLFKDALNEQFYSMKEEILRNQAQYDFGKDISKDLARAIDNNPYSDSHAYGNYNRLIYKQALGVPSSRIKQLRRIPDHTPITKYLSSEESKAVQKVKNQVIALLDMKLSYSQIKDALSNQGIIYQITLPLLTTVK